MHTSLHHAFLLNKLHGASLLIHSEELPHPWLASAQHFIMLEPLYRDRRIVSDLRL